MAVLFFGYITVLALILGYLGANAITQRGQFGLADLAVAFFWPLVAGLAGFYLARARRSKVREPSQEERVLQGFEAIRADHAPTPEEVESLRRMLNTGSLANMPKVEAWVKETLTGIERHLN